MKTEKQERKTLEPSFIYWMLLISVLFSIQACDQIEEDIEDVSVQLLSPTSGATLTSGDVLFWWGEVVDADEYKFQLVSPSFAQTEDIVLDTIMIKIDSINQEANKLTLDLSAGQYEWRVKAKNFGYETDYQTSSFVVE